MQEEQQGTRQGCMQKGSMYLGKKYPRKVEKNTGREYARKVARN